MLHLNAPTELQPTYSEGSQVCYICCRQKHIACHIIDHVIQMLHCFLPTHLLICQSAYKLERINA